MVADQRLTFEGLPPKDDACKMMFLETTDGVAMLGYAGLGETCRGTELADWMHNVLCGRDLGLEQCLKVLAGVMKDQLPQHLFRLRPVGLADHHVIIPAFVGGQPKLYTIDMVLAQDRSGYWFRHVRRVIGDASRPEAPTARLAVGGSGTSALLALPGWKRNLLNLIKAHDTGRISANAVSGYLAGINHAVHLATKDGTVGPKCMVAWRYRKSGAHTPRGHASSHQYFTGTTRESCGVSIPSIGGGLPMNKVFEVFMSHAVKGWEGIRAGGPPQIDDDALTADLNKIPVKPDEDLR